MQNDDDYAPKINNQIASGLFGHGIKPNNKLIKVLCLWPGLTSQ